MKVSPGSHRTRGLVTLLVLVILLSGCTQSPEAKSAKFVEAGKQLLQKNDARRAVLEFRNAVRVTPKNADAHYQLALALMAAGDLRSGFASLNKALELNPKHKDAQLRYAQLLAEDFDKERLKDGQQRLEALLEGAPDNAAALYSLALTELKLGEPGDAIEHLERSMAAAPGELNPAVTLAQAKLLQKDPKGAEEVLKKAISQNFSKSPEAAVILGRFYVSQKRPADAEREFLRGLSLVPDHAQSLFGLATLQRSAGRKQEAEQSFKRLAGLPDKAFKSVYAQFLLAEGRQNDAIRELERLVQENPNDRLTRTRLIAAYQNANRGADAEKVIAAAIKKNPKDQSALIQRAELLIGAHNYVQAEIDINQVLRLSPDAADAHYVMAKLQQAKGSLPSYREELNKTLQLNRFALPVRLELVQAALSGGKESARAALDVLNDTPDSQKQDISVLIMRNWALWTLGNLPEMRKGIDEGLARQRSTDFLLQDGLWKLRMGNPAGARASLEEVLKVNSADPRALVALNDAYVAQKQPAVALQKVKEYAASQPKSAPAQTVLGLVLLAQGQRKEAREAFTAAKTADPKMIGADLALARLDALEGKWDDAGSRLRVVLATDEKNSTARTWLGNVEAVRGDQRAALEHFRKVVETNPGNAQALNNLAYLLLENAKQPDEALKYAEKAVEIAPEDPDFADTLGWILYQKGVYQSAVKHLERAASKKGKAAWKYHLAMAYAKMGENGRAQSMLAVAQSADPKAPEAEMAANVVRSGR